MSCINSNIENYTGKTVIPPLYQTQKLYLLKYDIYGNNISISEGTTSTFSKSVNYYHIICWV